VTTKNPKTDRVQAT